MQNNQAPKKRLKISIFDVIIIAVVIVAGLVAVKLFGTSGASSDSQSTTVRYYVIIEDMVGDSAEMIQVGDSLVDSIKNYAIGTVAAVEVKQSVKPGSNLETGETVLSPYPGYKNAYITIEAQAVETSSQITVGGGYIIRAGLEASIKGPGYAGKGYIADVERSDG